MIRAGGKNFKTKSSLQAYCKYVLNNACPNSALDGEWADVLSDVVKMHERFHEKVLGQQFTVGVRPCSINPINNQFYIIREDGSDTDFSYYKAISGHTSKESRIKACLREIVKDQSVRYKDNFFAENQDSKGYIVCAETGLKIKKKDSHIDHYPKQFDEIVEDWVKMMNISSEDIVLVPSGDNGTAWKMSDSCLVSSFEEFHHVTAEYRIVLNKVNQQRKKAKRFKF